MGDFLSLLKNGIIGMAMADQPAIMTASGWRQDSNGDYVQDQQNNPDVEKLRDNLAVIAGTADGEAGLGFGIEAIQGLIKSGKIGKLLVGPDGKIFNSKINYNPNNYYRAVKKDAIIDAKNTGIIRGSNTSKKVGEGSGPWFGRGRPGFDRDYIIEGTPESAEWIDALKYQKGITDKLPKVNTNNSGAGKTIYDQAFQYGNEGFPMTSGNINQTPAANFTYYKKYPIIGFREKSF